MCVHVFMWCACMCMCFYHAGWYIMFVTHLTGDEIRRVTMECVIPLVSGSLRMRTNAGNCKHGDLFLSQYDQFDDYLEMVIQFGVPDTILDLTYTYFSPSLSLPLSFSPLPLSPPLYFSLSLSPPLYFPSTSPLPPLPHAVHHFLCIGLSPWWCRDDGIHLCGASLRHLQVAPCVQETSATEVRLVFSHLPHFSPSPPPTYAHTQMQAHRCLVRSDESDGVCGHFHELCHLGVLLRTAHAMDSILLLTRVGGRKPSHGPWQWEVGT